jgi:hypothetical protein
MKHKLPPLSDRALQSLRNAGNEAEEAADEIEALRSRIAELEAQNTQLTASLEKASAACIVLKHQQREGWAKLASGQEPDMLAICAALGFDPTNHHNAAKCPYCRPATPAQQPLSKTQIKAIFLANGFTIKDGLDDLKPYVYDAARAIEANHGIKEKP